MTSLAFSSLLVLYTFVVNILFVGLTFVDPAHVPLCQGSGSGYERGFASFWKRTLLRHRWLHHDCVQGDQGHWHTALQVCPGCFSCKDRVCELFQALISGLQSLKVDHSLSKRWHHSSGDCSGSLCCMGWCHTAATACGETLERYDVFAHKMYCIKATISIPWLLRDPSTPSILYLFLMYHESWN